MNCYLRILDRTVERIRCLPSTLYIESSNKGDDHYSKVLKVLHRGELQHSVKKGTVDAVLCPVNADENHWFLAVINIEKRKLEVWDSLKKNHASSYGKLRRGMRVLAESLLQDDSDPKWPFELHSPIQQDNGWDCGVFTCRYARALAGRENASLATIVVDGEMHFRERILRDMITGVITGLPMS